MGSSVSVVEKVKLNYATVRWTYTIYQAAGTSQNHGMSKQVLRRCKNNSTKQMMSL